MRPTIKALFLLLFICASINPTAYAQSNSWIVGTWQLSHDPDGDSKDQLVFKSDNTFINIANNGQKFYGNYEINNGRVKVILKKQGKAFMAFFLGFEKTKNSLHFYSEQTKKTAIYKKAS